MLGTGVNLIRSAYTRSLSYVRDGLKLYMPFRGGSSDEVKFVGTGSTSFDGTNDYIGIADSNDLSFGDGSTDSAFSITAWVKMDDATNFYIVSKGVYDTTGEWRFIVGSDDKLYFMLMDSPTGEAYERIYTTAVVTAYENQWTHFTGTYDGRGGTSANAGQKIYINGVLTATTEGDGGTYVAMENLGSEVHIGRESTNYADGNMCQVGIWERALTATEVQNVMYKTYDEVGGRLASGLVSWWALDVDYTDSKGSNDGTNYGSTLNTDLYGGDTPVKPRAIDNAPTVQADSIGAGSAFFDQDNADYITMGDIYIYPDGFSIAFWVKFVEITDNSALITKHADYDGDVDNAGEFYIINDDGICEFVVLDHDNSASIGTYTGTVFTANTWYHVACTHDGGTASTGCLIYINGVLEAHNANETNAGSFANINDRSEEFRVGAFANDEEPHDGNICQVGFWSAVLTQAQIQSVMEKTYDELTATEKTDLVSYWGLDVNALDSHGSNNGSLT